MCVGRLDVEGSGARADRPQAPGVVSSGVYAEWLTVVGVIYEPSHGLVPFVVAWAWRRSFEPAGGQLYAHA